MIDLPESSQARCGVPPDRRPIEPRVQYYGAPALLLSTLNEDGSTNLAPSSSGWWLGQLCMLGLSTRGRTFQNLQREAEIVLNLADIDMAGAVDRLVLRAGFNPVADGSGSPCSGQVSNPFSRAGLTPVQSLLVRPNRVGECRIAIEGRVRALHPIGPSDAHLAAAEVAVLRTVVDDSVLIGSRHPYIDPGRWAPLLMSLWSATA